MGKSRKVAHDNPGRRGIGRQEWDSTPKGGPVAGEKEIDFLLERYWQSECLIGTVLSIQCFSTEDGPFISIRLAGLNEYGLARVLVARGTDDCRMFPDFLRGRTIKVLCRRGETTEFATHYLFSALAFVEDLSVFEENRLWPWKRAARRLLKDPGVHLDSFEEQLCASMSMWGRPPSVKQRSRFGDLVEREAGTRPPTGSSVARSRRYKSRPSSEPLRVGYALELALRELRDIWLADRA